MVKITLEAYIKAPMQDTTHSIFRSAKRFFGGTMLSRCAGMLRDVSMAYAFGTHEAVAAFMVAFRLSHLLRRLFGEGALQTAFIPYFESLRRESPERAYQFFKDLVFTLSSGLFLLIGFIMFVLGGCLWGMDLSPGNREIVSLANMMMPSLLFICLFGLNASLLQCEKCYFTPGVAPVAFNVVWIISVCCLWSMPTEEAMRWLAGGVTLACISQWLITVPRVWEMTHAHGRLMNTLKLWSKDVINLGKPLMLGIVGVAASQINNALDAVFARYADPEGPALLWYALRIQQLPLALFGIAIAGALLPPLTRALKSENIPQYRLFLEFGLKRTVALMLPISAALLVMGSSCINLIYGHGDFMNASVLGTTWCLWGYGVGLLPMTVVLILAPAFYARGDYRTPTVAATVSMILNIILNGVMVGVLSAGAVGVALATSISSVVNVLMLAWGVREDLQAIISMDFCKNIGKIVLITAAASIAVIGIDLVLFPGSDALSIWLGEAPVFPRNFIQQITQCSIEGGAFVLMWGMLAWLLQIGQSVTEQVLDN